MKQILQISIKTCSDEPELQLYFNNCPNNPNEFTKEELQESYTKTIKPKIESINKLSNKIGKQYLYSIDLTSTIKSIN